MDEDEKEHRIQFERVLCCIRNMRYNNRVSDQREEYLTWARKSWEDMRRRYDQERSCVHVESLQKAPPPRIIVAGGLSLQLDFIYRS